ncbi:hypothetical protein [Cytobacillus oceanisediminis]|uniref:Uncharacterized protein n=1 Tax=Cytobacillus oceanisediminis TaxID=665099 RepID=A0A562JU10_9BACI|nr:hypothetical protein [Cytobacillus oceanisediminis]TWH86679.1 hypothetical protein IQ19_02702 [Cytobacillus oceanisediminis]
MALPAAIVISLYTVLVFYFQKKPLSFLQNSIVFMIITIAAKNYTTIMTLQLKLFKLTEDSLLFLFFLLHRDIIGPVIVLIFINVFLGTATWKKKVFIFIGMFLSLQLMDILSLLFAVVTYTKWKLLYAGIANSAFLIFGLGLAGGVKYLNREHSV